MNYSEQIYKLRKEADISQDALAIAIGTTRTQVSRWECGTSVPSMKYIALMADYFHTDINSIMGTEICEDNKETLEYEEKKTYALKSELISLSIIISVVYFLFGAIYEIVGRIMFAMSRAGAENVDDKVELFGVDEYAIQIHHITIQWFILMEIGLLAVGVILFILYFKGTKNKIYKYKAYKWFTLFLAITLACITGYLYKILRFPHAALSEFDFLSFYCGMFLLFRAFFTLITMVLHKITKDKIMIFEPSRKLFIARIVYLSIMFLLIAFFIYELILNRNNEYSFVEYFYLAILYFPLSFVINIVFEIIFLTVKDKQIQ